jgi:hypothetical protein
MRQFPSAHPAYRGLEYSAALALIPVRNNAGSHGRRQPCIRQPIVTQWIM